MYETQEFLDIQISNGFSIKLDEQVGNMAGNTYVFPNWTTASAPPTRQALTNLTIPTQIFKANVQRKCSMQFQSTLALQHAPDK